MIFTTVIIASLVLFAYYKIKQIRTKQPMSRQWQSTKGNIAVGVFLTAFGLDQIIYRQTTVAYIVGFSFIALGLVNLILGYRLYRYYLPLAAKESEQSRDAAIKSQH
ncbi:YtpI family protein [Texcoconibacillus texcoconensis]|uniref:Putative membrane protein n=1 Tax=Texcoconibacillus texcoconensis TaxID=1095777 RepID=A0A840QMX7_9BACI|nr:YtpI family protein [Texcoconibacillus texcoconensis]MBB5172735.1 putative membrane protein [Texcoconibacillus texcoconensis]